MHYHPIYSGSTVMSLPWHYVDRWFPASYNRGPTILVWLGLVTTFTAMVTKLWFVDNLSRTAEFIAFMLFLYPLVRNWSQLKHFFLVKLLIVSILLPIVFFGVHYIQSPETALEYFQLERLARILILLPFAWWLGDSERSAFVFYFTVIFGAVIGIIVNPEFESSVQGAFRGNRVDFGILNWQHTAMYFGLALIGLLSFLPLLLKLKTPKLYYIGFLWALLLGCSIFVIVATQTRATWLALTACLVISISYRLFTIVKNRNNRFTSILGIALLALTALLTYHQFGDRVSSRFTQEMNVIAPILTGDLENIPENNIGVRVETWIIAVEWIKERPLTGWGAKVRVEAIEQAEGTSGYVECCIRHFHNAYIEFMLAFGLIGLLVVLSLFVWLMHQAVRLKNEQLASSHWLPFIFYSILFFGIVNLFESFLFFWSGVFATAAVFTPLCSLALGRFFLIKGQDSS